MSLENPGWQWPGMAAGACRVEIDFYGSFRQGSGVSISRHFHDWKTPVLRAAVGVVAGLAGAGRRMRSCLIVVPTRHAGRRLRAELARTVAARTAVRWFHCDAGHMGSLPDGWRTKPWCWRCWRGGCSTNNRFRRYVHPAPWDCLCPRNRRAAQEVRRQLTQVIVRPPT